MIFARAFTFFYIYDPIISFTTLSESFIVPTSTSILNKSSPIYVHTCVIAEAPAATDGGDAANNE